MNKEHFQKSLCLLKGSSYLCGLVLFHEDQTGVDLLQTDQPAMFDEVME